MPTQVDRVIESYELLDKYTRPLDRLSRQTQAFDKHVRVVKRTLATLAVSAGSALTGALGVAAGILGGVLIKVGSDAFEATTNFERMQTTLESLTGSAERTKDIFAFLRKLDAPSPFTFTQLAQAATELQAFGVPVERTTLLVSKLGSAFPNKQLEDFVSLFGRLAAGDFPDIEALSGIGLSKLDFMKKGIKFDAQGSLLSSSRQTMEALEKIVNEKYGGILEKMAGTTSAKLASVQSAWDNALRKIGDILVRYVNPILDSITKWLDDLGKNDNFSKFFKKLLTETLKWTAVIFGALATFSTVIALLQASVGNFAGAFAAGIGAVIAGAASLALLLGGGPALKKFFKDMDKMGKISGPGTIPVPEVPSLGQDFPDNPALKTLSDIEKNTSTTATNTGKSLDLRRFALGGGDIGGMGVTAIERYGRGGGGGRPIQINATGVRDALQSGIEQLIHQVAEDLIRQGILR